MSYWDQADNVDAYERMTEGYDGRALVAELVARVPARARVLELGMGPGRDLDLLREQDLVVTGSDASEVFVERYRAREPEADVMQLDAVTMKTERVFDVIYSNKVLQHLTREDMRRSLERQVECLAPGGLALHTLWYGEGDESHHGLLFTQYTETNLGDVLPEGFELVEAVQFAEDAPGDSLRVVVRRCG